MQHRYRALFVGGPIDGQERVLNDDRECITVPNVMDYRLVLRYGRTLIYSVLGGEGTLERVWTRYTGEDRG
jgi:hypothetical protein